MKKSTLAAAGFGATVLVLGVLSYALRPVSGGGAGGGTASDAAEFFGRFHTLALHLPIGALVLLGLGESLAFVPRFRAQAEALPKLVLPFLAATSAAAFFLGVLLASGGGYPSSLLVLHRTLTLVGLAFIALGALCYARGMKNGYRGALFAALATISIGAHFGGSMTHGDGYLVKYAPASIRKLSGLEDRTAPVASAAPAVKAEDPRVFADILLPLFKEKCADCHGDGKVKGELRLDSYAAVMKGGEHAPTVSPGHSDISQLLLRMTLPESDDEHMPPDGKPGLSAAEIDLVRFWIDRGATEALKASEGIVPDDVSKLLQERSGGVPKAPGTHASTVDAKPHDDGKGRADASTKSPANTTDAGNVSNTAITSAPPSDTGAHGDRLAFRDDVAPLLMARCGSCHAGGKQKGGLRVDSFAAVSAGGKHGGGASALLSRVNLPLADDKHMPPPEEAQLTSREVALLTYWTGHGASDTQKESELPAALRGFRVVAGLRPSTSAASTNASTDAPSEARPASATSTTSSGVSGVSAISASPSTPMTTGTVPATANEETIDLYGDVVHGVLEQRCGACHTGDSAEGGLRVADVARMLREKDVIAGDASKSPLYTRMKRPASDDAHMPPADKPQPTNDEVEAIRAWIDAGAQERSPIAKSRVAASLLATAGRSAPPAPPPATSTPPGTQHGSDEQQPSSTASQLKVQPSSGGCGACTVGAVHGADEDDAPHRAAWLFALGVAVVLVRRRGASPTA